MRASKIRHGKENINGIYKCRVRAMIPYHKDGSLNLIFRIKFKKGGWVCWWREITQRTYMPLIMTLGHRQ